MYPQQMDHDAVDLIQKLLRKNKHERLQSPEQIRNHPFFQDIDFNEMLNPTDKLAPNKP